MPVIDIAPLTFGQMSLWRSIEDLPQERSNVANLACSWQLASDFTLVEVQRAFSLLVVRHETLRTRFRRSGPRGIEQEVWAPEPVHLDVVEANGSARDHAAGTASKLAARPFDITSEDPWRATLVTKDCQPAYLALCVHHLTADDASLTLLQNDLNVFLRKESFTTDAPSCREIAAAQASAAWSARNSSAIEYWRRTLAAAPPATTSPGDNASVVWGSLNSAPALSSARALADRLRISVPSIVLSVLSLTLAKRVGDDRFLLGLIAGNRNDGQSRALASSLNQLAPLLVAVEAGEEFDSLAKRVHRQTLTAYRHARFDVDEVAKIGRPHGRDGTGIGFDYIFNFMANPTTGSAQPPNSSGWSVQARTKGRDNGYPLYFKVGISATLWCELTLRRHVSADDPVTDDQLAQEAKDFLVEFHTQLVQLSAGVLRPIAERVGGSSLT